MKKQGTLRGFPCVALLLVMLLATSDPVAGSTSSAANPPVIDLAGVAAPVRLDKRHPFLAAPAEATPDHAAWLQEDHPFWSGTARGQRLLGIAGRGWWLQARLGNSGDRALEGIVDIHQPTVDDARFDLHCSHASLQSAAAGDHHPFATRGIPDRYPAFAFTIPPGGTCRLLISVQSGETLQMPVFLSDRVSYTKKRQRDDLLHGILLGIDLLLLAGACALWLSKRSGTSLLLLLMIAGHVVLVVVMSGIGHQFLWGDHPLLQRLLPPLSIAMAWITTGLLSCRLMPAHLVSARSRAFMAASYALAGIFGILCALRGHPALMALLLLGILLGLATLGRVALLASRQEALTGLDSRVLVATLVLVGSAAVESLGFLGLLPLATWYLYTLQAGFMVQGALLLDALAEGPAGGRNPRPAALPEQEISRRVAERTRELSSAMAQLKSDNAHLGHLSRVDGLTGTFNRRFMDSSLARLAEMSGTGALPVAFILIDIDFFKEVNDQYGHPVGDDCLREVAAAIRRQLRDPPDLLCRYGGEEFAVILPGCTGENALVVAEKIRTAVEGVDFRDANDERHGVTVSLGISAFRPGGTVAELVSRADRALYAAKRAGRNRCVAMPGA